MTSRWTECAVFFREFVRNFHTTGALLPSGRFLAAALARFVAHRSPKPRRILEVGPGTGAVTRRIIRHLGRDDRLDLVELNATFVDRLEHRFRVDPAFAAVAQRSHVFPCPVEELPDGGTYDVIVSGLPLNNFGAAEVKHLLGTMTDRLAPGGTLSFFEYIGVRPARSLFGGRRERERLRDIGRAMREVLDAGEIRRDAVLVNVPPAWVHHVRR